MLFKTFFPEDIPLKRRRGRPRLPRLPFFLVYTWNRMFFKKSPEEALQVVNTDSAAREFFEIPRTGLKRSTYVSFTKNELAGCVEALTTHNVKELVQKRIIDGTALAIDDFPSESPLNMSKSIDFPLPKEFEVQTFFATLPSLEWIDNTVSQKPNKKRGWQDYVTLYLFYLLWGFVSNKSFDTYLKDHPQIQSWLGLKDKPVQSGTLLTYIGRLFDQSGAAQVSQKLRKVLLSTRPIRKKLPRQRVISEFGELQGILGNFRKSKDFGAHLHYNASKGKYYLGRLGRIVVDTKTQVPLYAAVVSSKQALAKDLEQFGMKVTTLLQGLVRPLVALFDKGFGGTEREGALSRGFRTVFKIIITKPYNRFKPTRDMFRAERTAVEREIGHLETHLALEHPKQLGFSAAVGWTLAAVYLQQRVALFNHVFHPEVTPTTMSYLQRN